MMPPPLLPSSAPSTPAGKLCCLRRQPGDAALGVPVPRGLAAAERRLLFSPMHGDGGCGCWGLEGTEDEGAADHVGLLLGGSAAS